MRLLVLGGTAFLSRTVAACALRRGHEVVCAARGRSGRVPDGARLVALDRDGGADAYRPLAGEGFDAVVDVAAADPGWVRDALQVLGPRAQHWTFVSSMSVYADSGTPGQRAESAALLPPVPQRPAELTPESYGGAKVASERLVAQLFDGPGFVVRPGLIAGTGDRSDRFGYWPARLARGGPVLVPAPLEAPVQLVDVLDLAEWIVSAAATRLAGVFDAVCRPLPLAEALAASAHGVAAASLAGAAASGAGAAASGADAASDDLTAPAGGLAAPAYELVPAPPEWLAEQGVQPWAGPRSLPLWVPGPDYAGFMAQDVSASYAAGLRTRPLAETAAAALAHERALGLDRERKAGLSAGEEAELLAALAGRG